MWKDVVAVNVRKYTGICLEGAKEPPQKTSIRKADYQDEI
jgi:hypothetical protein